MLPLPPFRLHTPSSLTEALALLERYGPDVVLVAGGTDLLPNMKRGLLAPAHVVSLREVRGLGALSLDEGELRIGAMASLDAVSAWPVARAEARALAQAAAAVGGPQHRRMGTLGGNLCLDTRCRYYNQSAFWRGALGGCLKKDGAECHVVGGGRRCVAAASNDTAAAVIALDASLDLVSARGARTLPARAFYTADGTANTVREPGEVLVAVRVPRRAGRSSVYEKLRRRGAIDFPLLSVAASVEVTAGVVTAFELVVSALAARPHRLTGAAAHVVAKAPREVSREAVARLAHKGCVPLDNIEGDAAWRREMVPVLVKRALRRLGLGAGVSSDADRT